MFGGNFAPRGWALCNGQLLPVSQNVALFSILGTTYGGNGTSTFGLPNFQGTVPMHWGTGPGLTPRTLGETGGSEQVSLLSSQMPAHTHLLMANSAGGSATDPNGAVIAGVADPNSGSLFSAFAPTANVTMSPQALSVAGSSLPHQNMQPFLAVSFIIALVGIFPSRN